MASTTAPDAVDRTPRAPRSDDDRADVTPRRSPGRSLRAGLTVWRRSIQVRVVASTMALSALVVGAVGWFLLQQTRDGLLDDRVEAVVAEAANETAEAQDRLLAASGTDADAAGQRVQLIEPIVNRGEARGFAVVLAGPTEAGESLSEAGDTQFTPGLDVSSVPPALVAHFSDSSAPAWTYGRIRREDDRGRSRSDPAVVVGSQVELPADGETYTLYYLFPLEDEQETLALVTRALLTAAVLLLLLVGGVTFLVTRQVVTPIRLARQVAERLAAGRLTERLRVSGEDDLARLATSFNQMASNLQTQIRQLEELSRLQRRFVSDVSHELRTPLTTVRMASDVLYDARETFPGGTGRAAELLQTELDRFEVLLADLLEISRFDAGAAVLEIEDVDLADVARRVVDVTRPLAEARGVSVVVDAPASGVRAEADARRVERIIRNLVTNAIDHARPAPPASDGPAGDVVVRVAGDDRAGSVAVRDYGVGLESGESAMVFNRFWRADPARARTSGGTGLGLSISLEDAHLHGGWLQAWGRPGAGAQFRLTLPRRNGGELRQSPLPLVPTDAGVRR
ncbi:MtrAB system histidine kinase MtrB [Nocardioides sp. CFH 31398]|uniref:MtrAB system histidine kinase MtrB n=1 Tax=Nocardioides sp. CFH 31398 TaxID=2919579 RepID=UPI001F056049|nr:MtrAB system histidine kinase MtrB [Nocardioides sp. CFH 31398]MCH1866449.1 MtrAB system histidine kinase MtrB [Nocardioides sp. CFH 31398]